MRLAKPLDQKDIDQLKKGKNKSFHAVGGFTGLSLQITPPGSASWVLRRTIRGRVRNFGLGSAHDLSLAQATEIAKQKWLEETDRTFTLQKARQVIIDETAKDVGRRCKLAIQKKGNQTIKSKARRGEMQLFLDLLEQGNLTQARLLVLSTIVHLAADNLEGQL